MNTKDTKENLPEPEFELETISSSEMVRDFDQVDANEPMAPQFLTDPAAEDITNNDPIFSALAEPKLPELPKENRARLLMQSPTKIQFYWSIQQNPFQTLRRAFGDPGSYSLVAKLVNESGGGEDYFEVEAEGSWWFNVNPGSTYRAEIGFYAPNRPFVRIMFSNTLETPRKSPSPQQATDADWAVSAKDFAEVLDSTGYSQDALEVALAGDDHDKSDHATQNAFSQFIGEPATEFGGIAMEEVRFALLALASGCSLEDLRGHIGELLFSVLRENTDKLSSENAIRALGKNFEIDMTEGEVVESEEVIGNAVFGLSLVNFPRTSRKKRTSPKTLLPKTFKLGPDGKISPVSSIRR